jgi:hypothetical protein
LEELRYARAPTNRQSLGRLNPAVAALSAVAKCDALNSIGVLGWHAETSSADGVFDRNAVNSQEGKTQRRDLSANGAIRGECEEETPSSIPSSFHASDRLGRVGFTAQAVEVLQQSVEAAGSGTRVQVDTADLLDQLLQGLELLQPQEERVVLH